MSAPEMPASKIWRKDGYRTDTSAGAQRSAKAAQKVAERDRRNKVKAGRLGGKAKAARQAERIGNVQASELAASRDARFPRCEWGCGTILPDGVTVCGACQVRIDSIVPEPERREPDLSSVHRILANDVPRLIAEQRRRYGA